MTVEVEESHAIVSASAAGENVSRSRSNSPTSNDAARIDSGEPVEVRDVLQQRSRFVDQDAGEIPDAAAFAAPLQPPTVALARTSSAAIPTVPNSPPTSSFKSPEAATPAFANYLVADERQSP
jgi:hypothetical protein